MAYSAMTNLAAGALVTEAEWDKIKGNFDFLVNPPRARVKKSAAQSVPNNTVTVLTWNQEDYDTDTIHDTVTNNSRLTAVTAGTYHIQLDVQFAADVDGFRLIQIVHNTAGEVASEILPLTGAAVTARLHCATDYVLAAGQYVEAKAWHTAGAALDVDTVSRFTMRWVAA